MPTGSTSWRTSACAAAIRRLGLLLHHLLPEAHSLTSPPTAPTSSLFRRSKTSSTPSPLPLFPLFLSPPSSPTENRNRYFNQENSSHHHHRSHEKDDPYSLARHSPPVTAQLPIPSSSSSSVAMNIPNGPSDAPSISSSTPPPFPEVSSSPPSPSLAFDYDLVVIGGGSGGLACSKEAAKLGKKVAVLDFVRPTPLGTKWGLGGTCVNVGCIPKKLFHQASLLGESISDAKTFGWKITSEGCNWEELSFGVQNYVRSLNFGYRVQLQSENVKYLNAMGRFVDNHTLECTNRSGVVTKISAQTFVVAVGGRPKYPNVPGDKELCITSDDLFWRRTSPGKTLCIGASYISLETAGFLAALGLDVSVMARSIFLRGFDQEIAEHIAGYMERHGTNMIRPAVPTKFEETSDKKVRVWYRKLDGNGVEVSEVYETVVLAVGRDPETANLGLENAGVAIHPKSGKILTTHGEQTSRENIFAIGDVIEGGLELTPVAIKAGTLLARRLYAGSSQFLDYNLVPTTVFTPLEYGCIGLAEEAAREKYGSENIEAYISFFKPLEWQVNHEESDGVAHREDNVCYAKLVVNLADKERVVGFHVVSPNAGEITQGFAVAMRMGATKADFDATVGIHPTIAEEFTIMRVTRSSGASPLKTGC